MDFTEDQIELINRMLADSHKVAVNKKLEPALQRAAKQLAEAGVLRLDTLGKHRQYTYSFPLAVDAKGELLTDANGHYTYERVIPAVPQGTRSERLTRLAAETFVRLTPADACATELSKEAYARLEAKCKGVTPAITHGAESIYDFPGDAANTRFELVSYKLGTRRYYALRGRHAATRQLTRPTELVLEK